MEATTGGRWGDCNQPLGPPKKSNQQEKSAPQATQLQMHNAGILQCYNNTTNSLKGFNSRWDMHTGAGIHHPPTAHLYKHSHTLAHSPCCIGGTVWLNSSSKTGRWPPKHCKECRFALYPPLDSDADRRRCGKVLQKMLPCCIVPGPSAIRHKYQKVWAWQRGYGSRFHLGLKFALFVAVCVNEHPDDHRKHEATYPTLAKMVSKLNYFAHDNNMHAAEHNMCTGIFLNPTRLEEGNKTTRKKIFERDKAIFSLVLARSEANKMSVSCCVRT